MSEPDRIDFKELLRLLESEGKVSTYKVSLMMHRQFNTIKHWRRTGRLEHYDGVRLLMIFREYCKDLTVPFTKDET